MRFWIAALRARERARSELLARNRQRFGKLCEFGVEAQIGDLLDLGADLQEQPLALDRDFERFAAADGARHLRQQGQVGVQFGAMQAHIALACIVVRDPEHAVEEIAAALEARPPQFERVIQARLLLEHIAKGIERLEGVGMLRTQHLLIEVKGLPEQILRLIEAALIEIHDAKITHRSERVDVVRSKSSTTGFQRLGNRCLCGVELTKATLHPTEIVQRFERVLMLRADRFDKARVGLLEGAPGLRKPVLEHVEVRQIVDDADRARMGLAEG